MTVLPLKTSQFPKAHWIEPTAHPTLSLSHLLWLAPNVLSAWNVPHPRAKSSVSFKIVFHRNLHDPSSWNPVASPMSAEIACLVISQCYAPARQTWAQICPATGQTLCTLPSSIKKNADNKVVNSHIVCCWIKWDNACKVLSTVLAHSTQL